MKKKILLLSSILLISITLLSIYQTYGFPLTSLMKKKNIIVIDVGHGGSDPGKVSADGTQEKDINLQIASYLRDYLIAQDYIVYLTRETDCGLYDENVSNKKTSDLNNRVRFFKEKEADYVVSIHQNSYPDTVQHGAQTFFYTSSADSEEFAKCIQSSLLSFDSSNSRQAKSSDSYFLLKHSVVPSVIIECGFLSNPEETAKLKDPNYQKQLAYHIALGICNYAH